MNEWNIVFHIGYKFSKPNKHTQRWSVHKKAYGILNCEAYARIFNQIYWILLNKWRITREYDSNGLKLILIQWKTVGSRMFESVFASNQLTGLSVNSI